MKSASGLVRPHKARAGVSASSISRARSAAGRALIGDCRLLKLGRRLAVGEVSIISEGSADVVCHATGTYSIPDRR